MTMSWECHSGRAVNGSRSAYGLGNHGLPDPESHFCPPPPPQKKKKKKNNLKDLLLTVIEQAISSAK